MEETTEETEMNTIETGLAAQAHYLIEDRIRTARRVPRPEHHRRRRFRRLGWL